MKRILVTSAIAVLTLLAGPAIATTPSPLVVSMSSIQLAARTVDVIEPRAEFQVRIANSTDLQPYVNGTVQILFASCAGSDLHLADAQPGVLAWDCASRTATALTDANGVAIMRLLGSASAEPGNSPGVSSGCAIVRVDGMVIAAPARVAAYDLDGVNGVNGADQSLLMATLFAGPAGYRTRCDYNADGVVNGADLAKFLSVQFGGGSLDSSPAPVCF